MANTIQEILMKKQGSEEWIMKWRLELRSKFPLLMQKFMVLMSLICQNSGKYTNLFKDVVERSDFVITSDSFMDVFFLNDGEICPVLIAEALHRIKDPLVIVNNVERYPFDHAKRAIFLDVFKGVKENIIKELFREKSTPMY